LREIAYFVAKIALKATCFQFDNAPASPYNFKSNPLMWRSNGDLDARSLSG